MKNMKNIKLTSLLSEQIDPTTSGRPTQSEIDAADIFAETLPGESASDTFANLLSIGNILKVAVPSLLLLLVWRYRRKLSIAYKQRGSKNKYKELAEQYKEIDEKLKTGQLDRDFSDILVTAQTIQTEKVIGTKPGKDVYRYSDKTRNQAQEVERVISEYREAAKEAAKNISRNMTNAIIDLGRVAVRQARSSMEGAKEVIEAATVLAKGDADILKKILPKVAESMGYKPAKFSEWITSKSIDQKIKALDRSKQHAAYNEWFKQFSGRNLKFEEWGSIPGNEHRNLNDFHVWGAKSGIKLFN